MQDKKQDLHTIWPVLLTALFAAAAGALWYFDPLVTAVMTGLSAVFALGMMAVACRLADGIIEIEEQEKEENGRGYLSRAQSWKD